MPEGHKTHFLARQQTVQLGGQTISVTSPQGRFTVDAAKVHLRKLEQVTAAGKHLFYRFECDRIVHVHLGRYGSFRSHGRPSPPPRGKVRMRMIGDEVTLDLNGPSTCRVIDPDTKAKIESSLGPDPLAGGRQAKVWAAVRQSGKPIGGLLLDQSIVAGVGNIFRAEVLFETGIHPQTPGNELTDEEFTAIWKSLVKMMKVGLKYGKIISVTAKEVGKPLARLDDKERFRVYGKTTCPLCESPIRTIDVASRRIYFCAVCQAVA